MLTLVQISKEHNINLETLRKRAFNLRLKPKLKAPKSKAFLFNKDEIQSILNYTEKNISTTLK